MDNLSDLIPIPSNNVMNPGLSSAEEATMIRLLGRPGNLTTQCSEPNAAFKAKLTTGDVGPFRVTGLGYAVESLKQIFDQVRNKRPNLFDAVKTAGVLCVRARRSNPAKYSNHSWGTAVDIYFGTGVVPQGSHQTHRGV